MKIDDWNRRNRKKSRMGRQGKFFSRNLSRQFNCPIKTSEIERSIAFDWQFFCEFDFVRLCLAIDYVRLPNVRLDTPG